jgi:HlyD family secretion protein
MQVRKGNQWKWWTCCGLLAAVPVLGGGYFLARGVPPKQENPQATEPAAQQAQAVQVEVTHPKKGEDRTTTQPGSIQAFESVQLYAEVSGFLKTQNVDIGDRVKKEQVLAQVDVPDLEKQVQRYASLVDQARARVLQMKAGIASATADLVAAQAVVPQAEAMAKSKAAESRFRQKQLDRMKDLFATKSVDERLVDEKTEQRDAAREAQIAAKEAVNSANARVASMRAKIQQAEADEEEAKAQVKVAQAELEKAQVLVNFATVKAPFDGVITQRNFFPQDFVRAAHEGGARMPLFTVQRTDLMRVVVQIPDRDVPYCNREDRAFVSIDALPGEELPAKVSRIASSEDPDTRLMHVEVDLPNPTGKICNGMYGQVRIILAKSKALAVPSSCLLDKTQNGKGYVYVVRNGHAYRKPVTIGADNGLQVGILSGLTETDVVVLRPDGDISDGAPVVGSSKDVRPEH